jgi:hypothetical protein
MSISSFFFQGAYFSIGIGAICYLRNAVGYKHIRKLEEAYQKALLDGREPSGIEAAGHANVKIMKFCLVIMCVGVLFLILGVISERLEVLL